MKEQYRFNPTFERLDLHNCHVIDWKWILQDLRGCNWYLTRHVCWLDSYNYHPSYQQ